MKKIILSICVTALLLSACGGDDAAPTRAPATPIPTSRSSAPAAEGQITIRLAIFDWDQGAYHDLIKAFEEENPDIRVKVVSINDLLGISLTGAMEWPDDAERRLASAADVVPMEASAESVEQGLVRDLTPLIAADPDFQPEDFYPNTLDTYRWGGGTWSLPTTLNFLLFLYDRDAFDAAGLAYPEPGWSWDDLAAAAGALTVRQGGEVARWGLVVPISYHRLVIESRAGRLIDDSVEPPAPRFDDPAIVDAVRWYTDLYLDAQVMPYFEPAGDEVVMTEEEMLIDKGDAALWTEVDLTYWYRSQQANVGAVPFPVDNPGDHSTLCYASGVSMSAGTAHPDAAWRLMEFLTRQQVSTMGVAIQSLPARRSVAESSGFWDEADPEFAATLRYAIEHAYPRPQTLDGYGAFDEALQAILQGEKSVEAALSEAQTQARADIQAATTERAAATPAPTVVVAPAENETPVPEGVTAITFMPSLGDLDLEPYRDLARRFHELHPDILVDVQMVPIMGASVPDTLEIAESADCFQAYPSLNNVEDREAVLSLAPFLDADPAVSIDDYYRQAVAEFTWQGQLLGLPADIVPYVIEYNKDLFGAAGVEYPAAGWTWEEFVERAVALTHGESDDEKQYGFVGEYYELNDLVFFLEHLGATLIDPEADPPALSFDDAATLDAVVAYAALSTEYGIKPVYLTDLADLAGASSMYLERQALVDGGRAAMWTSSSAIPEITTGARQFDIGVAPLPVKPGVEGAGTYTSASGYFISASSDQPQACWLWITFLSGQPGAVRGLPARRSVAESDAYREQVGAERAAAYLASVAGFDHRSSFQAFSEEAWLGVGILWLGRAYGQIVEGEATPEEALAAAQDLADDYRACIVAAGDFEAETWEACAQEVDPTLPAMLFEGGD
ncbi:MAG: extracellular solute-binding protein [Anaerolineae bacterium]|nr:extracellular solute-binding protein [Anaerolineae bacterium]